MTQQNKWNLRGTTDLQRTLLSFNGLSDGTRRVEVVTNRAEKEYGVGFSHGERLKVTQTKNKLTIEMPVLPAAVAPEVVNSIASAAYERVASFLNSSDMSYDLAERGLVTDEKVSPLAMITEAFEGARASRKFGEYLRGTQAPLAMRQASRLNGLESVASKATKETGAGYIACETLASSLIDSWAAELIEAESSVLKNASPDVSDACSKLADSGILDNLHKATSYEDTRELANQAFKLLYDKDPEQEEQECQQQQQQQQSGYEGDQASAANGAISDEKKLAQDMMQEASGRCSQPQEGEEEELGEPARGEDGRGTYIPTPDNEVIWKDLTNPNNSGEPSGDYYPDTSDAAAGLANALRRVVQVRSQAHWVGAQKRGRLQRKNLYRAAVGTVGNGEWNAKIRRKREQAATLDTSVCLLIDYSGSMRGREIQIAMGAALQMSKALGALGIPFAVEGFTVARKGYHQHMLMKRYNQPYNEPKLERALFLGTARMTSNEDYKAIDLASRSLLQQRTKRKIMIVLSDGSPACPRPGKQGTAMRMLMKDNSKYIDYVGIGIRDRSVEQYYDEHYVINQLSELTPAILSTLKSKLV